MNIFRRITALFLCAVFIALSAVSAAGDIETDVPDDTVAAPLSEINDSPSETDENEEPQPAKTTPKLVLTEMPVSLSVGSKITIKAEPVDFETQPDSIEWSSDNTAVATVDKRGIVTCVSAGRAKITATAADGARQAHPPDTPCRRHQHCRAGGGTGHRGRHQPPLEPHPGNQRKGALGPCGARCGAR